MERKQELNLESMEPQDAEGSGMVMENGLLVYVGSALPPGYLEGAISRLREERARRLLDRDSTTAAD